MRDSYYIYVYERDDSSVAGKKNFFNKLHEIIYNITTTTKTKIIIIIISWEFYKIELYLTTMTR